MSHVERGILIEKHKKFAIKSRALSLTFLSFGVICFGIWGAVNLKILTRYNDDATVALMITSFFFVSVSIAMMLLALFHQNEVHNIRDEGREDFDAAFR